LPAEWVDARILGSEMNGKRISTLRLVTVAVLSLATGYGAIIAISYRLAVVPYIQSIKTYNAKNPDKGQISCTVKLRFTSQSFPWFYWSSIERWTDSLGCGFVGISPWGVHNWDDFRR
jgi:hypothetical protein